MIACPQCEAENPPEADRCEQCQADLAPPESEEIPTLRTRPRLLVLRSAAQSVEPPSARPTDHGAGPTSDPPQGPPIPKYRLRVIRGLRVTIEYPLFEGQNLIGRSDDRPVDIDLRDQEPLDRIWASRQHAVLAVEGEVMTVEDLHSTNGTYVNRHRLPPGSKRRLKADDVLQIGTIQLKVTV
jgi:hypothetical protein